jgi:hypothetical protein
MNQQSPRGTATIIWAALLAGATMFLGVALYLVFRLRGGVGLTVPPLTIEPALIAVSLGLSVVTVALSWLWAVRMTLRPQAGAAPRPGAFPPGPEANAVTRLIIAGALCEGRPQVEMRPPQVETPDYSRSGSPAGSP